MEVLLATAFGVGFVVFCYRVLQAPATIGEGLISIKEDE